MKGKKLTSTQRKALVKSGFPSEELENYLLQIVRTIEEGSKRPTKDGNGYQRYSLIHRTTGEIKEINIR